MRERHCHFFYAVSGPSWKVTNFRFIKAPLIDTPEDYELPAIRISVAFLPCGVLPRTITITRESLHITQLSYNSWTTRVNSYVRLQNRKGY